MRESLRVVDVLKVINIPSVLMDKHGSAGMRTKEQSRSDFIRKMMDNREQGRRRAGINSRPFFLVLRGVWGKSELTVREAGKLAVAKHTLHLSLLSPCILLILLLS
ncbi:MAG: hypothetical protein ACYCW7_17300, partial [Pseudomonadaceae bacterium]